MDDQTFQAIQDYISKVDAINAGSSELTVDEQRDLLQAMRDTVKRLGAGTLEKRDADTLRMLNDVADDLERVLASK